MPEWLSYLLTAAGGGFVGFLPKVVDFMKARDLSKREASLLKREEEADALAKFNQYVAKLEGRVQHLEEANTKLAADHMKCAVENAMLKMQIDNLQRDMTELKQKFVGGT